MTFDASLYAERPAIKEALKALPDTTQRTIALRLGYKPPTFTAKINGTCAMDPTEEKKILADLAAMMEAAV